MKCFEDLRQLCEELSKEDTILFDSPSYWSAFIGFSQDDRAVYSYEKMIEFLIREEGWNEEEAIEFIDYNTIRAIPYFGDKAPIVVYDNIYDPVEV